MADTLPDGMMRTRGGVRITARPGPDRKIATVIMGIEFEMDLDDSRQLRDILQAAELRAARGDVMT